MNTYMELSSSITSVLAFLSINLREAEDQAKGASPTLTTTELAICSSFLQEVGGSPITEPAAQPVLLSEKARKRFCSILQRVVRGQEGLSRQEQLFIRQYWQAYQLAQANKTSTT